MNNSTYFNYYPYNAAFENTGGMTIYGSNRKLFLEYSPDNGAHWTRTGYMSANFIKLATQQGFEISGLKPNTVYRTRIGYVGDGTYLNTTTIRTGMASDELRYQQAAGACTQRLGEALRILYRRVSVHGEVLYLQDQSDGKAEEKAPDGRDLPVLFKRDMEQYRMAAGK